MGLLLDIGKKWFFRVSGKIVSIIVSSFLIIYPIAINNRWLFQLCDIVKCVQMDTNFRVPQLHKTQRRRGRWTFALACRALLHWHGGLNDGTFPCLSLPLPLPCHRPSNCQRQGVHTICVWIHHCLSQKLSLKRGKFPGNSKNHFFPMSKSSPIVYTTYGHVSYAAILYTKPEGPYFHHIKYHHNLSSHSRFELGA